MTTPRDCFHRHLALWPLFEAIETAVVATGPVEITVSKTQIAFCDGVQFAWVWLPEDVVKAPTDQLVLALGLPRRVEAGMVKAIAEPVPGRFTHHIPLNAAADLTADLRALIGEARAFARSRRRPPARVLPGSGKTV